MDKDQIRKEFNQFLDSASDETIRDFLRFIKNRKSKKPGEDLSMDAVFPDDEDPFKHRSN